MERNEAKSYYSSFHGSEWPTCKRRNKITTIHVTSFRNSTKNWLNEWQIALFIWIYIAERKNQHLEYLCNAEIFYHLTCFQMEGSVQSTRLQNLHFPYHTNTRSNVLPRVGVSKPNSFAPSFSEIFSIVKTHASYCILRLYLAGVAAAQLRWHLASM